MGVFTRGSLVRLRAGLPADLRVTGVSGDDNGPAASSVAVAWLGPDGRLRRALLPADALEPSGEPGGQPSADEVVEAGGGRTHADL